MIEEVGAARGLAACGAVRLAHPPHIESGWVGPLAYVCSFMFGVSKLQYQGILGYDAFCDFQ